MKLIATLIFLLSANAEAVTYIQPTIPGTNARDLTSPGTAIDDDQIYSTIPGSTARDLTRGGYKRQGSTWVPTLPASRARDFSRPSYRAYGDDDRMVVPVTVDDTEEQESPRRRDDFQMPCPPVAMEMGDC